MHAEAELPAETHEVINTPCPALSKRKMIAHEQLGQSERLMQDLFALAMVLSASTPYTIPGKLYSAEYLAAPVTLSFPSTLSMGVGN